MVCLVQRWTAMERCLQDTPATWVSKTHILNEVGLNALQAASCGTPPGLEHDLPVCVKHRLAAGDNLVEHDCSQLIHHLGLQAHQPHVRKVSTRR